MLFMNVSKICNFSGVTRRFVSTYGNVMLFTAPNKKSQNVENYILQLSADNYRKIGNMEPIHMANVNFREIIFNLTMTHYFQNKTLNEVLYFLLSSRRYYESLTTFESNYCNFVFIQLYEHLRKAGSHSLIPLIHMHVARPMLRKCGYNLKYLLSFYITVQNCKLTDTDYLRINRDIFSNIKYKKGAFHDYRNTYNLCHRLVMRLNNVDPVLAREKFSTFLNELAKTYVRGFNHVFIKNNKELSLHTSRGRSAFIYDEMLKKANMFVSDDTSEESLAKYLNALSLFGGMENFDRYIKIVNSALSQNMGGIIRRCVRLNRDKTQGKLKSYPLNFDSNVSDRDDATKEANKYSRLFQHLGLLLNSRMANQRELPVLFMLHAKMSFEQKLYLTHTYFKPMLEYLVKYIENYIFNDLGHGYAASEFERLINRVRHSNVYIDWASYEHIATKSNMKRMYAKQNLDREHVKWQSLQFFNYNFKKFTLFSTIRDPILLTYQEGADERESARLQVLSNLKEDVCCVYFCALQCLSLVKKHESGGLNDGKKRNFPLVLTGDRYKDFGVIFKALPTSDLMNLQFNQWMQMVKLSPLAKTLTSGSSKSIYDHKLIPVANYEDNKIDFLFMDQEWLYRI